jgi:hypothetical protein
MYASCEYMCQERGCLFAATLHMLVASSNAKHIAEHQQLDAIAADSLVGATFAT